MSVWGRKFRTNGWLWAAFGIAAFAEAGWLLEIPFEKAFVAYWELAWIAFREGDSLLWQRAGPVLLFCGLIMAVPCAGVGWILQAVILLAREAVRGRGGAVER